MKLKWITLVVMLFAVGQACAFGSNDLDLGLVKADKTYTDTITVCKPGFDNNFIIEIEGSKDWLTVSPTEFSLGPDDCQPLNVVLQLPADAAPGIYEAQVFARGQEVMPSSGGVVGYKITAKSLVSFMVADASGEIPGMKKEITIESFEAVPTSASPGEVVKFLIKVKNTGNIKNTFETQLPITKGGSEVETFRMGKLTIKPGEIKEVKLLWDTDGREEGAYEAGARITYEGGEATSNELTIVIGEQKKEPQSEESKSWPINPYIIGGAILVVLLLITIASKRRR